MTEAGQVLRSLPIGGKNLIPLALAPLLTVPGFARLFAAKQESPETYRYCSVKKSRDASAIRYPYCMRTEMLPRLNAAERNMMDELLAGATLNDKQATRLQVILGRADGKRTDEIAEVHRILPVSISVMVRRFNERGLGGLLKQPNHRSGKSSAGSEGDQSGAEDRAELTA